ncbi:prepilin peptidase [Rodentibacter pneumotropicus]|uniref:A24 family peptidase n=1 Tax=Rodentibacter pneumotropicus TaxID=758 RepID=A0AAW5LEK7_9PAST|nr:A24 family peptidase [Rodentibacter pneumotropicus]MCQ9121973.1 A24 family peptidase [Rodentibacter pneumotropicus]OOF68150.1 prepilin peptidase [Rodentibacter pneumotropicus]
MIYFASFLLGGIFGIALWLYVSTFAKRLQTDIYHTYTELFPQNPPPFQPYFSIIQEKKCGHFSLYFFTVGFLFALLTLTAENALLTLWLGCSIVLLWAIAYLDWQYQLISTTLCLILTALGLIGASQSFSSLTLEESLQSAVIFCLVFYGIYWIAKWYYKEEAFGQGDYWLALGIGSYLPLKHFPIFLLIACLLGIFFTFLSTKRLVFLPFAPFLILSSFVVWLFNYYS